LEQIISITKLESDTAQQLPVWQIHGVMEL